MIDTNIYSINDNKNNNNELINNEEPIPIIKKSFPSNNKVEYQGSLKYKLGVCLIGKNFSSLLIRIFCSLNKDEKIGYLIQDCGNDNRYPSLNDMAKKYNLKGVDELFENFQMFIVVRNPIDRLINGFMQLCYFKIYLKPDEDYCYGCNTNLTCFINKLYTDLLKVVTNKKIPDQFYDYHYYPQIWIFVRQCDYYKYKNNYTYIKYSTQHMETFYKSILNQLEKVHVPNDQLIYLDKFIHSFQTIHTTSTKNETYNYKNFLYEDSTLLKKVCKMFYYDFVEFDFKFPKKCHDI